jgi:hypothetical protein
LLITQATTFTEKDPTFKAMGTTRTSSVTLVSAMCSAEGSISFSQTARLTFASYSYDYSFIEAEGFPNDNMDHIIFATQYLRDGQPGGRESVSRNVGGIASANYSYDDRFLLDVNFRLTGLFRVWCKQQVGFILVSWRGMEPAQRNFSG